MADQPKDYGIVLSTRTSRGHDKKLFIDHSRIEARRHYFGSRVCEPWNSLPADVVNANSETSFKKLLRSCDLSTFLSYPDYNSM